MSNPSPNGTSNPDLTLAIAEQTKALELRTQQAMNLMREMVVNGRKLTDEQLRGRAAFAVQQGLDPVSEVHTITDNQGRTMSHTMSVNGLRRKNQEQAGQGNEILLEFIELPKDKLPHGAIYGYECRLRDGASYTQWQRRLTEVGKTVREALGQPVSFQELLTLVGQPPVYSGYGILYASELNEYKDKNFNPLERAKKRAEVNARHHRFPTNAPVYEGDNGAAFVIEGAFKDQPGEAVNGNGNGNGHKSEAQLLSELGYGKPAHSDPSGQSAPASGSGQQPAPQPIQADPVTGEVIQEGDYTEAPTQPEPPQPDPAPVEPPASDVHVRSIGEIIEQYHKDIQANANRLIGSGKAGVIVPVLEACFLEDRPGEDRPLPVAQALDERRGQMGAGYEQRHGSQCGLAGGHEGQRCTARALPGPGNRSTNPRGISRLINHIGVGAGWPPPPPTQGA